MNEFSRVTLEEATFLLYIDKIPFREYFLYITKLKFTVCNYVEEKVINRYPINVTYKYVGGF